MPNPRSEFHDVQTKTTSILHPRSPPHTTTGMKQWSLHQKLPFLNSLSPSLSQTHTHGNARKWNQQKNLKKSKKTRKGNNVWKHHHSSGARKDLLTVSGVTRLLLLECAPCPFLLESKCMVGCCEVSYYVLRLNVKESRRRLNGEISTAATFGGVDVREGVRLGRWKGDPGLREATVRWMERQGERRDAGEVELRRSWVWFPVTGTLRATSHTSQEPWPWHSESPKESVQKPSQHTPNIV